MIIQLHEENENGKSNLPGLFSPLWFVDHLWRRPSSRVSLRRVVALGDQGVERAEAQGSKDLFSRSRIRSREFGTLRTVGTSPYATSGTW